MTVINTNIGATIARNAIGTNERAMATSMERLSTGLRINSAKDDAAGLAISTRMTSQVSTLNMGVRNANDAISMIQTADGAMIEQSNMLQRMRELAVQASSDTVTLDQKSFLNNEFQALKTEIDRIGANTSWNGGKLLDGTGGLAGGAAKYKFQVGSSSTTITADVPNSRTTAGTTPIYTDVSAATIDTAVTADAAIALVDASLLAANTARSKIGSAINQLTYAADNMSNIAMNTAASRSRIEDTDYAQASTELARTQIIQQAATAMLAQANQSPQSVLALLK